MINKKTVTVSSLGKLGIRHVLDAHGFDLHSKFRLVRHAPDPTRYDRHALIASPWFLLYQAIQVGPVYGDSDVLVVFVFDGGTRAKLFGIYRVLEMRGLRPHDIPEDCPYKESWQSYEYFYELEHLSEYADLDGRVIIDWGKATQSWVQGSYPDRDKPVLEMLPPSGAARILQPFSDYLDFTLSHAELRGMIENPDAHADWQASLSAVAGIYLILAETTGQLYVGSAYGEYGIWGRWEDYATNGHGGNTLLEEMIEAHGEYPESFRYSVLQILPRSTTNKEVHRWEKLYKDKLGSRATGLNFN